MPLHVPGVFLPVLERTRRREKTKRVPSIFKIRPLERRPLASLLLCSLLYSWCSSASHKAVSQSQTAYNHAASHTYSQTYAYNDRTYTIIMFYPRSQPPISRLLLLLFVIIQAVTPRGAAEPPVEGLSPSSSLINITSFMKREVSQGDVAPLWFTVTSSDDMPQHVNVQVLLPAASVTYRQAAVFPPLDDGLAVLHVSEDEDRDMVVVIWTDVALAPGQSRVFNVDVKIEAISERAAVQLEAVVMRGSDLHNSVILSTLPVTLTKRPKITKAFLAEKAVEKLRANPHKGRPHEHEHDIFAVCKPLRQGPAAVEDCLAACYQEDAQPCLACGYDPWSGCLCKGKGKEDKDRYLDGVPVLYEREEVIEEVEGVESQAAQPYQQLFLDQRGEILIFPGLLSEEHCLDMESYLAELVAEHQLSLIHL